MAQSDYQRIIAEKEALFDKPFPVLEMGDFVLRELQPLDSLDLLNYIAHPEVHKYISEEDTPTNLKESEAEVHYWASLFRLRRSVYWAIARKSDNMVIGTCGYNMWTRTHDRGELSYDLAREYWGQGIMTSLLRMIIKFGFEEMKMVRIQATVVTSNKGSIRVLQKLGFKDEGLLRAYGNLRGKFYDSRMMSILRNEYDQNTGYKTTGAWIKSVGKKKY